MCNHLMLREVGLRRHLHSMGALTTHLWACSATHCGESHQSGPVLWVSGAGPRSGAACMLRCCVRSSWEIWALRAWRVLGGWPDGRWRSTVGARWTWRRAAPTRMPPHLDAKESLQIDCLPPYKIIFMPVVRINNHKYSDFIWSRTRISAFSTSFYTGNTKSTLFYNLTIYIELQWRVNWNLNWFKIIHLEKWMMQ